MAAELAAAAPTRAARPAPPLVSIVIKCFNEEQNIERCIRSLMAQAGCDAEIILADCMSSDRTVEIARRFPIRIVQLTDPATRGCGAAAQLGWQHARGAYLFVIDADMQLCPGFLPAALQALERDPSLAGIGGVLIEMSPAVEFVERLRRPHSNNRPGFATRLTGAVVYRMAAFRADGYFMDRNLHSHEELDLGLRLRARGWRLRVLPTANVWHFGHVDPLLRLQIRRWQTRAADGNGELLRALLARADRGGIWTGIKACRYQLLIIAWWLLLLGTGGLAARGLCWPGSIALLGSLPFVLLLLRKRDLRRAMHSLCTWHIVAAGLIRGFAAKRVTPDLPLPSLLLNEPP